MVSAFTVEALDDSRLNRAGTCALAAAGSAALSLVVSILTTVLVGGCEMASEGVPENSLGEIEMVNVGWDRVSLCLNSQNRLLCVETDQS